MVRKNEPKVGNVMKTPIRRSDISERDLSSADFFVLCYVKSWVLRTFQESTGIFFGVPLGVPLGVPPKRDNVPIVAAFVAPMQR